MSKALKKATTYDAEYLHRYIAVSTITDKLERLNTSMAFIQQHKDKTPFHNTLDENGMMYNWTVHFEDACEFVLELQQAVKELKEII